MKNVKASYKPSWELESLLWQRGYTLVAGIDEAGRGALAGPVVAAAVVLPYGEYPFKDSKKLDAATREHMAQAIKEVALAWALASASAQEVDQINVLAATKLAATRALKKVSIHMNVDALVTDYLKLNVPQPSLAVAKGDSRSFQIAAASILAKTSRDAWMVEAAKHHPEYGFEGHKGYGAPKHLAALDKYGPCELHRLSYKPVAQRRLFAADSLSQ